MKRITLTDSQVWVVVKALQMLTSETGEAKILSEFPGADLDALSKDVDGIVDQLVAKSESFNRKPPPDSL